MANVGSLNRTLFFGANLPVLRGIDSESIDLIATDSPWPQTFGGAGNAFHWH